MTGSAPPSNAARRAVLVCEEVPVAGTNGAGSYNLTVLRALRALGWRIDLLVTGRRVPERMPETDFGGRVDFLHARRVGPLLVPTSPGAVARSVHRFLKRVRPSGQGPAQGRQIAIGRFLSDAEVRAAGRRLAATPPDAVFADTIFRSGVLAAIPPEVRHRILIGHDVFHHRVASLRANGFEATPAVDRAMEERLYRQFTGVVSINASDDRTAREMAPGARHATVLPSAGGAKLAADGRPGAGHRLFYLGSLGAHNVDGLAWFLERVWPAIRRRLPDATLDVAGAIAERFPDPVEGVTFHGRVRDLETLASRCAVAVNPVRMGSGIKIKMVDYFGLGLTCVATPKAAEGFPQDPAPPFEVAGEDVFGDAVVTHLTDIDARVAMAGRVPAYLTLFSDAAAAERVSSLLAD